MENHVGDSFANSITIRNHQPGDMGYITYRHGVIYAKERGYNHRFETLVGRITADFLENYEPTAERCWIAEKDGAFVGCILLMKDRETTGRAKLRCFLVEESARGSGLGSELIRLCLKFAREVGYDTIGLRTDSTQIGARRLYTKIGFEILSTQDHQDWGGKSVGENWELKL